jgi:hypothetical protein
VRSLAVALLGLALVMADHRPVAADRLVVDVVGYFE